MTVQQPQPAPGSFADIITKAHRATPGGRFTGEDRKGLLRRAKAMGLRPEAAEAVITELTHRPRHPVTRGIE